MKFEKYQHVERYGTAAVKNISVGECWVFPKIDGTNASCWLEDGEVQCGSRRRHITVDDDNAGFAKFATESAEIKSFLGSNPNLRLYGEWLVPHSLRTYRDDAWRKFYVFDVYNDENMPIPYEQYKPLLEEHGIEYIPPICSGVDMTYEQFVNQIEVNNYLIKDGSGYGEGIVIKNYEFTNRFGRTTWAKIVTSEFKETAHKTMGAPVKNGTMTVERMIADTWCTKAMVDKVYAKIDNEEEFGFESKHIPRLLGTVFHDLVTEEVWDYVKKLKNPTIDYSRLQKMTFDQVKEHRPDVFGIFVKPTEAD